MRYITYKGKQVEFALEFNATSPEESMYHYFYDGYRVTDDDAIEELDRMLEPDLNDEIEYFTSVMREREAEEVAEQEEEFRRAEAEYIYDRIGRLN